MHIFYCAGRNLGEVVGVFLTPDTGVGSTDAAPARPVRCQSQARVIRVHRTHCTGHRVFPVRASSGCWCQRASLREHRTRQRASDDRAFCNPLYVRSGEYQMRPVLN